MTATTEASIRDVSHDNAGDAHTPAADAHKPAPAGAHDEHQQHPLKVYFLVWILLFVLSAASYGTDYLPHGYFRTALILLFMVLKAGFIVAIFMHMAWERLALVATVLLPPLALGVLLIMMALEANYTNLSRLFYYFAH
jgi:cytochrome c oxidase subunit IV